MPLTSTERPPTTAIARLTERFSRSRETGILAAVVFVTAVTTVVSPTFLFSSASFQDLLLTPSILILIAVG